MSKLNYSIHLGSTLAQVNAKLISNNDASCKDMLVLLEYMMTFSATTADCEHGFSTINLFKTSARCRLTEDSLCVLMRVKNNGPGDIKKIDPAPHVQSWKIKSQKNVAPTGEINKIREKMGYFLEHNFFIDK